MSGGWRLRAAVFAAALLALGAAAPAALADAVPFADDGALPWTSGAAARSPVEAFMSQVSESIARVPGVEARCEGESDWATLAGQRGFDPADVLGYVTFWIRTIRGVPVGTPYPGTLAEFAPSVCLALQRFAAAGTKPTKCETVTRQAETVYETVQVPKKVKKKVRVNGKWKVVTKTVLVTQRVPKTVERDVPGPVVPCYAGKDVPPPASLPSTYWDAYEDYALALQVLTHESMHLAGVTVEAEAECKGMQWVRFAAEQFGAASDDASAIARYVFERIYPRQQGTEYWSDACVENGPLDLTPGDGVWP